MRVTNRVMYDSFLNNMQSTLGAFMESNIQGGTQKKINKPSDDPAGMALVLNTRRNIDNTVQHQRNIDTAKGWLNLADSTLGQVSTTLREINTLAEQAATGTMTDENRDQVATQLRQLFGQLLNLSNTQFENKSIFAGHKYDKNAFGEVLSASAHEVPSKNFQVEGNSKSSVKLEFETDGTVGGADDLKYRWTNDGGKSWKTGTLPAGSNAISMDGVTLRISNGTAIKARDPEKDSSYMNGTVVMIQPNAVYLGDDNKMATYGNITQSGGAAVPPGTKVSSTTVPGSNVLMRFTADADLRAPGSPVAYEYSNDGGVTWTAKTTTVPNPATGKMDLEMNDPVAGTFNVSVDMAEAGSSVFPNGTIVDLQPRRTDIMGGPPVLMSNVQGTFQENTLVRIDGPAGGVNLAADAGKVVDYSYSNDGGKTWIKAKAQTPTPANGSLRLALPGGHMDLKVPPGAAADTTLNPGTQLVIHPDRADLNYEIMQDTYVPVNSVGKDIFGGMYNGQSVEPVDKNIFETVGKLIAFAENNDSKAVADCLDELKGCMEKMLTEEARIGGLENRLTLASDVLSFSKLDQEQRLSYTEDIDLTTLLNNLAKQEMAYNTVLKSSSMIMQLNLTKFV